MCDSVQSVEIEAVPLLSHSAAAATGNLQAAVDLCGSCNATTALSNLWDAGELMLECIAFSASGTGPLLQQPRMHKHITNIPQGYDATHTYVLPQGNGKCHSNRGGLLDTQADTWNSCTGSVPACCVTCHLLCLAVAAAHTQHAGHLAYPICHATAVCLHDV
jgi:hypothetical protein